MRIAQWIFAAVTIACLPAAAMAQDDYPFGTLAFFETSTCPTGWDLATAQAGFFLVPFAAVPSNMVGATVNSPMQNGELRTHSHTFTTDITLAGTGTEGAPMSNYGSVGSPGVVSFSGTTDPNDSGMPYLQLLLCKKTQYSRSRNPPVGVPQGVATFFSSANCPTGWKPIPLTSGRFIIGLPTGGNPQTAFGGTPLSVGEDRTHGHTFSGSVTISPLNAYNVTTCCSRNYAVAGPYSFAGSTDPASTGLPYAVVTQCQPSTANDQDPASLDSSVRRQDIRHEPTGPRPPPPALRSQRFPRPRSPGNDRSSQ